RENAGGVRDPLQPSLLRVQAAPAAGGNRRRPECRHRPHPYHAGKAGGMSFARYPRYKDSGVDWLGQGPEDWSLAALKQMVQPQRPITYGIVQAGPHIPDGIPYVRPADMTDEQGVASPDDMLRTSSDIASAYSRSTIRAGDLVCSIGPSFGK